MSTVGQTIAIILGSIGILSFVGAVLVYFIVPQRGIQSLREDQKDLREHIADRDREAARFRVQRAEDVARLEADEGMIYRLDRELTTLRSWRYGAERYIRALCQELKRHDVAAPDPALFGLNGEMEG